MMHVACASEGDCTAGPGQTGSTNPFGDCAHTASTLQSSADPSATFTPVSLQTVVSQPIGTSPPPEEPLEIPPSVPPVVVPRVRKFQKIFRELPPGLPRARPGGHTIPLIPGAQPVAKGMYRLSPAELKECAKQVKDLLQKGFIEPSKSPFAAPILFCGEEGCMVHCVCALITEH